MGTDTCRRDGDDQQQDCEDSKARQRLPCRSVVLQTVSAGSVHANEFEEEVAQCDEVHDDDDDHARDGFATDPPGGEEE